MDNEKHITIDELAIMVGNGFESMDKRFDRVEARFDKIEKFLLEDHRLRIERLELQMKELREAIALK